MAEFFQPKLIGITGKKGQGKDTLGNFYVENYGYQRIAFADALKKACVEIFGFSDEQLYGDKKEIMDDFWKVSPRKILQQVGTNLFREHLPLIIPEISKEIWIKVVQRKILGNPNACFVVTDVRFLNEYEFIKEMGGIVIKVQRNSLNTLPDIHSSEMEMDNLNVDFEIENNGTKEDLFNKGKIIFTK